MFSQNTRPANLTYHRRTKGGGGIRTGVGDRTSYKIYVGELVTVELYIIQQSISIITKPSAI